MTTEATPTPRVWIGCLAAYNGGDLHGKWVDAVDVGELETASAEVIRTSPAWRRGETAEEYAVMDYDGFGSISTALGEWPNFETVAAVAKAIEEHGPAFIAYVEACEPTLDREVAEGFACAFRGLWESERDYAECEIDELGFAGAECIPEALRAYLDMELIVRAMFQHGSIVSGPNPDGGVYVFDTRG